MREAVTDAQARYEACKERLGMLYLAFEKSGHQLTASGSMGQEVEHPIVKMIREHEKLCADLEGRIKRQQRGPKLTAVPGISRPASARLRAVEGE